MTWWHTEPGHQQAWYWPCLRVVKRSEIVTWMDGYWYEACWWPGDLLSQVTSRLDIDLVSELWSEVRLSLGWTVTDMKPADDLVTYWARSSAGLILTQSQVVKRSEIVTWMEGYWYQACWGPGEILSLVISRLDIDLVSCEGEARTLPVWTRLLISSLLMTWWHTEPSHQHAWFWPSLRVVKWSEMVTCMDTFTNIKPAWWPGDMLSLSPDLSNRTLSQ